MKFIEKYKKHLNIDQHHRQSGIYLAKSKDLDLDMCKDLDMESDHDISLRFSYDIKASDFSSDITFDSDVSRS